MHQNWLSFRWVTGAAFKLSGEEDATCAIGLIYLVQFQWVDRYRQQRLQSIPFQSLRCGLHQSYAEQAAKEQQHNWQLHDSNGIQLFEITTKNDEDSASLGYAPSLETQS